MTRRRRLLIWLAMLLSGGTMFQAVGFTRTGLGGACQPQNFFTNGALSSVDFCYVLDCQNGFFGGVVQPCDPTNPANDYLIDCTGYSTGTGTGTGTGTTTTNTQQTTTTSTKQINGGQ